MSISRRSFLKMAGLTTVAVAGAALFAGCSVASHMKIQLAEGVTDDLKGKPLPEDMPDSVKAMLSTLGITTQEQAVNKMIDLVNGCLVLFPLFGVSKFKPAEAREQIYDALDKYGPMVGADADTVAEIKQTLDQLEIETDDAGYVVATGNIYSTITITFKKASPAQTLSL